MSFFVLKEKRTMPVNPKGPESVPDQCSCTWTWSVATQKWGTADKCNTLDLKPNPPNYHGTEGGAPITTACIKPGGGGGDDEGMEEIDEFEEVDQGQNVEQLGKQAADALMQLRKLAESGNHEAGETLHRLMGILG